MYLPDCSKHVKVCIFLTVRNTFRSVVIYWIDLVYIFPTICLPLFETLHLYLLKSQPCSCLPMQFFTEIIPTATFWFSSSPTIRDQPPSSSRPPSHYKPTAHFHFHLLLLCTSSYSEYIVQLLPTQVPIILIITSIFINNVIIIYYKDISCSFKRFIESLESPEEPFIR